MEQFQQKQQIPLSISSETGLLSYQAAYFEAGSGEVLILLHGFMGSSNCWRSLLPLLQPHYHCICLDLLGFGESSKPIMRYDIHKLVAFVCAFAEAKNLSHFTLVGHSLGGWVSAAYALAYPKSVDRLILVAPAGIRDDSFCGRYDHLRPLLWQTPLVDWVLTMLQPLANLRGQQATLNQIRNVRRELNAQPAARSFLVHRMRPEDAVDTVEKEIHQLRVPTLVVAGEADETIPLWHCQTYAQAIPNARLEVLANADHGLPQNHAAELAAQILPFLKATPCLTPHLD